MIKYTVRVAHRGQNYRGLVEDDETRHTPLHKGLAVCRTFVTVGDTMIINIEATNLGDEDIPAASHSNKGFVTDNVIIAC